MWGFFLFRAKPQRPRLPPARPQREPPQPRRSPPPRVIPHPLTPLAHQRPAWLRATVPGRDMAALLLGEAQVTQPGGSWAFLPPLLHPQPLEHHLHHSLERTPVCCGSTSTARAPWRLWLVSRETRAVPISCYAGCRTGTNITAGALPSHQVADSLALFECWGSARKVSVFEELCFASFLAVQ